MRGFFFSVLLIAGCTTVPKMPVDVALVPNDCANQQAITQWLIEVAKTSKSTFQNQKDYEQFQSQVKSKIWNIRYACNPA